MGAGRQFRNHLSQRSSSAVRKLRPREVGGAFPEATQSVAGGSLTSGLPAPGEGPSPPTGTASCRQMAFSPKGAGFPKGGAVSVHTHEMPSLLRSI